MENSEVDELQRVWALKERGAISEEEYASLKAQILARSAPSSAPASSPRAATPPTGAASLNKAGGDQGEGSKRNLAAIGCVGVVAFIIIIAAVGGSGTQSGGNAVSDPLTNINANIADASKPANALSEEAEPSPWSYSEDQDKVRGATTYYATTTSTNSIAQSFPYDSDTTMRMQVRQSPAYGTDVVLTISSGQMMCPSYEGCSGTVRFDQGRAERIRFNGPEDNSSDTIFVEGAKSFIAKLQKAQKVTIEKTLYDAGSPQFEFNVKGLKWKH